MKTKTTYPAIIAAVMIGCISFTSFAGELIDVGGFGASTLTDVKPVKKSAGECVSFEADFSQPLDKEPSAMLDIEHHFVNLLNSFLQVTKISEKKYRFALTASTDQGCPKIEDESRLTISTYSGKETDDKRQVLPASITFKAEKSKLQKE